MPTTSFKISVDNNILSAALAMLRRVAKRGTLPITECVLLRAKGKTALLLAATGLDVTVICKLPANNDSEGAIAINAVTLANLCALLGDSVVGLATNADKDDLTIWNATAQYKLSGLTPDEFPQVTTKFDQAVSARISAGKLKWALAQARTAAYDADDRRPTFRSVCMRIENNVIECAATDSYRLAVAKVPLLEAAKHPPGKVRVSAANAEKDKQAPETSTASTPTPHRTEILVPLRAIDLIDMALKEPTAVVELLVGDDKALIVNAGDVQVHAALIQNKFVPYDTLLPKEALPNHFTVDRAALIAGASRARVFSYAVRLDMRRNDKKGQPEAITLGVGRHNADVELAGDGVSMVSCAELCGTPEARDLQADFVLDALKGIGASEVMVEMGTSAREPIFIRPKAADDGVSAIHLILPCNQPQAAPQPAPTQAQVQTSMSTVQ